MRIYFNSRLLSEKLGINLAKWKRWSRDFLPPDPLGGLQSGVARQFHMKDAFKVYLGGYLVSELKFTIPEAQKALKALSPWLKINGFFSYSGGKNGTDDTGDGPIHHIYAYRKSSKSWGFTIRTFDSAACLPAGDAISLTFAQQLIDVDVDPITTGKIESAHMIAISTLFRNFLAKVG